MKRIEELMKRQAEQRNPGHELGRFLLAHTNSLEYLVAQLQAYLEAAEGDLKAQQEIEVL